MVSLGHNELMSSLFIPTVIQRNETHGIYLVWVTLRYSEYGTIQKIQIVYSCFHLSLFSWRGEIWDVVFIPPEQRSCWGVYWFHSVRLSVCPSVRLSRLPCPLCNIYSSGWILSILTTNDHYHERVCRTQWPLTLTYIFKVIWPWLKKSCPLCNVYSSGWILVIFGTIIRGCVAYNVFFRIWKFEFLANF